eukprot:Skav225785  [mRNA]  locus=scaffold2147:50350:55978:+ [translate_table: standard]
MKSPSSLCSGSPGASSLSSEDAERIQKLERRILGVAQFQVERDLLEEFRYRDYEQKLQAEERTWQAQLCDVQKLRAEAAQRKKAQHEEVEDRRQHLQGNLANVRESKVTAQDAFCQRRCRELREAQQRRIEDGAGARMRARGWPSGNGYRFSQVEMSHGWQVVGEAGKVAGKRAAEGRASQMPSSEALSWDDFGGS